MKKLLIVSSFFIFATLLALNVNLHISNSKMNLTFMENVKAEYGWEMHTVPCGEDKVYKRCEDVQYSSNCNVHDQTFCGEPE